MSSVSRQSYDAPFDIGVFIHLHLMDFWDSLLPLLNETPFALGGLEEYFGDCERLEDATSSDHNDSVDTALDAFRESPNLPSKQRFSGVERSSTKYRTSSQQFRQRQKERANELEARIRHLEQQQRAIKERAEALKTENEHLVERQAFMRNFIAHALQMAFLPLLPSSRAAQQYVSANGTATERAY